MPLTFTISGAFLNVHRAMMLLLIVPLFVGWASGKAPGRILFPDILLVLAVLWMLMALLANHPAEEIFIFWLSQATETIGPYLLARLLIRNKASFLFFVKCYTILILFFLPFAMIESVSDRTILVNIFDMIPGTGTHDNVGYGERLGLTRAQVTFEHPILYGSYCAIPLALILISLKAAPSISKFGRWARALGTVAAVFFSVSSGALAAAVVQIGLMLWDRIFQSVKARWKLFTGLFASGYLFVDILSNRAPLVVLISYVTFSPSTAFHRVLIWRYGTDDVTSNPFFGIGLNDWTRPIWMLPSVDNFWLLWAMRYGLVGFLLLAIPIILILYRVIRRDFSEDPSLGYCRKGYVFSVIGVSTALATVAFWGGSYAMLCFLIGSGVWMLTAEPEVAEEKKAEPADAAASPSRYTRFASPRDAGALRKRPGHAS